MPSSSRGEGTEKEDCGSATTRCKLRADQPSGRQLNAINNEIKRDPSTRHHKSTLIPIYNVMQEATHIFNVQDITRQRLVPATDMQKEKKTRIIRIMISRSLILLPLEHDPPVT
jgi:hypothetical protein